MCGSKIHYEAVDAAQNTSFLELVEGESSTIKPVNEFTIAIIENRNDGEPYLINVQNGDGAIRVAMSAISPAHARMAASSLSALLQVWSPGCAVVIDQSVNSFPELAAPSSGRDPVADGKEVAFMKSRPGQPQRSNGMTASTEGAII